MTFNDKAFDLSRLIRSGKLARREFIQLGLAAGMTVAASEMLFVKAARAAPTKGGHFNAALGLGSTTDTLDPALFLDHFMGTAYWGSVQSGLGEMDAAGNVVPDLAESIEPTDGGAKWIVKLRKGSTFHNGKAVEPADVIATYRHHMGEDSKSAAKPFLADVIDIQADGSDTVIFTMSAPNADFPAITTEYHLGIMPAGADGKADWASGVGTGPFKLKLFEPGVKVELERNDSYYREGPWFDSATFLSVKDATARTNALMTGEVQYIDRAELKTLALLERNSALAISQVTGYGHYTLPMNGVIAPFDNINVRLAVKHAIDREDILKKVAYGYGLVGNDNPIAPSMKYAIDPAPKHSFDPDKAKFYLKEAGQSSLALSLSVSDAAFPGAIDAAQLIKDTASRCNIDVTVVREAADGYWSNVWLKAQWCGAYWSGRPTIGMLLALGYHSKSDYNESHFVDARFDELVDTARGETDEAKRAALYAEAQQILHDKGSQIVLMFNSYVSGYAKTVTNAGTIAGNYDHDGCKIAARWWFA